MKRSPIRRRTPLAPGNNRRLSTQGGGPGRGTPLPRRSSLPQRSKPLRAVSPKRAAHLDVEDAVRLTVWERTAAAQGTPALVRCTYPHGHPLMATVPCSAPGASHFVGIVLPRPQRCGSPEGWSPDPGNRGYLALCHCIPVGLAGPLAWDPDNLFVGCDAGNAWQEDRTGDAIALGVQGRMGDHVLNGRVI